MDSAAETQLAEMLRKFPSRSKTKSTLVLATMRAYAVVCVCRKLFNTPCYVVKRNESSSKLIGSLTRCFRLITS